MASSFITKHSLAVLALISVFIFPCILGDTDAYIPQVGAAGSGYGNIPQTGGAAGHDPETGVVGTDEPGEIFSKALLCFNDNYVYSSCEQAYRLTASGIIDVPAEYTDQYCNGACLTETNLVLNCIESLLSHFQFYNHASVLEVRSTIKSGCSYGPERGNFNVAQHMQTAEYSAAHKGSKPVMFGILLMVIYLGYNVLV